ncbi:MAG: response regulator transcription factor [Verrucomicrobia bacterium]|nr:response regulator transcription factor [Verrucomicrobiota bacterium]
MTMNTRVVVVDDHPMFRERLVQLIEKEPEMEVCAEADNVPDALARIRENKPEVAILDITLKGSNGLELLKDLRAHGLNVPVLVLSMHEESLYAERALRAGARGYITKYEPSSRVLGALREVLRGEIYLDAKVMARIVKRAVGKRKDDQLNPIERLSDRELEVFDLLGRGRTTREIGARLHVGLTTVDTYRARIKEKLRLENGARLFAEASRWVQSRE